MKRSLTVFLVLTLGLAFLTQTGHAQLFKQEFTTTFAPLMGTSGTAAAPVFLDNATYVHATAPSTSQFTAICAYGTSTTSYHSVSVDAAGTLTMDRAGAGNAALIRNFPFPGPPKSVLVKFDFDVTSYRRGGGGTANNYVNFNIGTAFDSTANRPSGGFAKFGIGWYRSTGVDSFWYVNNINSGTVLGPSHFLGKKTLWFAVNNSGGTLSYTSPTGASETVADQTWDLWVGTAKEFDDQPVLDNTQSLSTFKIVNGGGSNTIGIGNLIIDQLVATDVETPPGLPLTLKLEQNFPNPFNPSTTIRYEVPTSATVRLTVHDLLGREVAKLVRATQEPGRYEAVWQGTTSAGVPVASGVYVYRLEAGSNVMTQRMMLLR